jgi:hypothetical protein
MTLTLILVGLVLLVLSVVAYLVVREADDVAKDAVQAYAKRQRQWEPTEPPKPVVDLLTESLKRQHEQLKAKVEQVRSDCAIADAGWRKEKAAHEDTRASLDAAVAELRRAGGERDTANQRVTIACEARDRERELRVAAEAKLAAHTCPVVPVPAKPKDGEISLRLVSGRGRHLGDAVIPARARRNALRYNVDGDGLSSFVADHQEPDGTWVYRRVGMEH